MDSAAWQTQVDRLECSREQALRIGSGGEPVLDARTAAMSAAPSRTRLQGNLPRRRATTAVIFRVRDLVLNPRLFKSLHLGNGHVQTRQGAGLSHTHGRNSPAMAGGAWLVMTRCVQWDNPGAA